jgi:hypothetical protein
MLHQIPRTDDVATHSYTYSSLAASSVIASMRYGMTCEDFVVAHDFAAERARVIVVGGMQSLGYQNGLKTPHFCRCKKH